jgi:hypothetical protein
MEKRYHDAIKKLVSDKEVDGCRFFGQPLHGYTKEELMKIIAFLGKQNIKNSEQHLHDINFLSEIHKAHIKTIRG